MALTGVMEEKTHGTSNPMMEATSVKEKVIINNAESGSGVRKRGK